MALSAGGWGRMSEKVASALKPFLTARVLDSAESLGQLFPWGLKYRVSCSTGQTLDLRAPAAHHCPLETAMLQKVEPLSKQARHSGHCDPSLVHCWSAKCSKNLNEKKLIE